MSPHLHPSARIACPITGEVGPRREFVVLDHLRPSLVERIRQDHPDLPIGALLSHKAVDSYRKLFIEEILRQERGELTQLDREVARSLAEGATVSANTEADYAERRSLGERLSDGLANFGGSWFFLIIFAVFLALWMAFNVVLARSTFDPYPFILLNLILSCLAAIQAPIIMMSQKRQEAKDRLRALNDYQVNLKAELEIRHLHEKVDHLITRQWERLAEIQAMQIELLQERR